MKLTKNIFQSSRQSHRGAAGYDNSRENIDPHVKTRAITASEGTIQGIPTAPKDIVNKEYVDTAVSTDLIPALDNTYNLGSQALRWKMLYAVGAILLSIIIGNSIRLSAVDGVFLINASTEINGSLSVRDSVNATTYYGNGSQLTGVSGSYDDTWINSSQLFNNTYDNSSFDIAAIPLNGNISMDADECLDWTGASICYNGSMLKIKVN